VLGAISENGWRAGWAREVFGGVVGCRRLGGGVTAAAGPLDRTEQYCIVATGPQ
jgi:hypothetical protein